MSASGLRFSLLCGLLPTIFAAGLSTARPQSLAYLDSAVYDSVLRSIPVRRPSAQVVIVDIDERSLSGVGQWPWSRARISGLIRRLQHLGASAIALDMVLAEADRADGSGPAGDAALVETLSVAPVILGYAFRFDSAIESRLTCLRHPLALTLISGGGDAAEWPLFRATGAVCNVPALSDAAPGLGFLNAAPDADGILRRVPLLVYHDKRVYPSLALAAALKVLKRDATALRLENAHAVTLGLQATETSTGAGIRSVNLDGRANLLLRYRGPKRTIAHVSAIDVLDGTAAAPAFRGAVVFVGTTALGTREVVATPLDTLFSGVEIQATVADNLIQGDLLYRPSVGATIETLGLIALCVLTTLAVRRLGHGRGSVVALGLLGATWGGCVWLAAATGMMLSPLYPSIGICSVVAVMAGTGLTLERVRADTATHRSDVTQHFMVTTLLTLTEMRDAGTGQHSRRIQRYVALLGHELSAYPRFAAELSPERIHLLSTLATLHDIGKVGIPDAILNKTGALDEQELAEMRRHPEYGRDVLVNAEAEVGVNNDPTLTLAKAIVYTHHERWDGTGYPQGLSGDAIPLAGRIVALVDVYDAVVTHRPYRAAMPHVDAVELIRRGGGSHFDPDVVDAFLHVHRQFEALSRPASAQVA